jgi:hypothetical protein
MFRTLALNDPSTAHDAAAEDRNRPKPKRAQVARACAWCRLNRIRCDSSHPCRNCRKRNQDCRRETRPESLTLPLAQKLAFLLDERAQADMLATERLIT